MQEEILVRHVETEYAGFWLRLGATVVDGLLLGGISYILKKIVPFDWTETALSFVFALLVIWFNSSSYQGTPGKMILGIKVTDLEGNRISFLRSMGRYCLYYPVVGLQILGFIYSISALSAKHSGEALIGLVIILVSGFLPIIGVVMIAFTSRKQGLHDKVANTLVILR
ncbi:MAG: hypothetical protein K0R55_4534 [Sporomusa sp.]|jgi:uncharacterized RDD family membrane protein YckC|nr:hypothetical protein [Sporomusa sp.]